MPTGLPCLEGRVGAGVPGSGPAWGGGARGAAVLALLMLLVLPACGAGDGGEAADPSTGERETPTASPDGTRTAGAGTTTAAEPEPEWTSCANAHWGYTVEYPSGWYTASLGPRTDCAWFARERFELEQGTEAPLVDLEVRATIGTFRQAARQLEDPYGERTLERAGVTIDGRKAIRFEKQQTQDLLYPSGTRTYGYLLNRDGAAYWVLTLDVPGRSLPYGANKEVVDRAVRSLTFAQGAAG